MTFHKRTFTELTKRQFSTCSNCEKEFEVGEVYYTCKGINNIVKGHICQRCYESKYIDV